MALHKHSNALVDVLPPEADSSIAMLTADEKPDVSYVDIGECGWVGAVCVGLRVVVCGWDVCRAEGCVVCECVCVWE